LRSTWQGEFFIIKENKALNPDKIYISVMIFRFFISTMIFLIAPGLAFSGSINGKITYSPKVTPSNSFDTGIYKNNCGIDVPNEKLLVEDQGLMNVVVSIERDNIGGTPGEYKLEQKDCRYTPHVSAGIIVTDNPFHNISGQAGTFQIKDFPSGKYTINAWHEVLGSKSQTVVVGKGNAMINFDFSNVAQKQRKNDIL